jgi:UDP-N-acetylmuramoyl-L-alanyl-D-glutamate--2,6-diaminopimelate ligase
LNQKLENLIADLGGRVEGVTNDSRKVRPGYIYVAVRGRVSDGDDFAADALAKGAIAVVSETAQGDRGFETVRVDDARYALARLSAEFYGFPSRGLYTAGITGTNGKTTTAYLVWHILESAGRSPGLVSTVEYRIGERIIPASRTTPDSPDLQSAMTDMAAAGCESVVMEVSSHAIDQKRVACIDYDSMVFTNLSREHLDYHGSMDEYFGVKREAFLNLCSSSKSTAAVINVDDPYGAKLSADPECSCRMITYGTSSECDVFADDVCIDSTGSAFLLSSPWGSAKVKTGLIGRYNISNIMAAVTVCCHSGVSLDTAAGAVQTMDAVPGRLEEIRSSDCPFKVFVDYAHTDDALEKMLAAVREVADSRLILVFGCGGDRDRSKRPAMASAAAKGADLVFLTSDNPRSEDPMEIMEEASSGFGNFSEYRMIPDRREAISSALEAAGAGDVVVIAGKGHEQFQEMSRTTQPFDDRQVAREVLQARGVLCR